jgi:hypothetical protein
MQQAIGDFTILADFYNLFFICFQVSASFFCPFRSKLGSVRGEL